MRGEPKHSRARRKSEISELAPGLYVTATPIGHARDVTLRALEVLEGVDLIAAEDTRVTSKLLAIFEIAKPLMEKLRAQPYGTVIIASGTSCRQQIQFLAPVRARHIAEVLAGALA